MKLHGKVAIVTGAASGIGREIALRLAREGADVVMADINMEKAGKVAEEIQTMGRRAVALEVNVTKKEDADRMARTTVDLFGRIDILVNDAGGSARQRNTVFHESQEEVWDYVISLNLKGTLLCTRAVINHMIQRRTGKIINIGSIDGMSGAPTQADYSAAKGGVIAFTKALAKEVGTYGVNVNCVSPGTIETQAMLSLPDDVRAGRKKLTYLDRLGKPDDVAAMVAFLASDDASFITGQNMPVCGGRNLGV